MPSLIAIAGGSGSGKSTFCRYLTETLEDKGALILALDNYYKTFSQEDIEAGRVNYDHPDALDLDACYRDLILLVEGKPTLERRYDLCTHTGYLSEDILEPQPYILFEGLYTLIDERFRSLANDSYYIRCSEMTRLERRLNRDQAERARSVESIQQQFNEQVQPMHVEYVAPQRAFARRVIEEGSDLNAEAILAVKYLSALPAS